MSAAIIKPKVVFIYGLPAVGKLTIAKELTKITNHILVHNHMILNFVFKIFSWKSILGHKIKEDIYYNLTKELIKSGSSVIYTHAYASGQNFPSGLSHQKFIKKIKQITEKSGGIFCPVYISCNSSELLKRAISPERNLFGKTNTKKGMSDWLKIHDNKNLLFISDAYCIDNTSLSAKHVARLIKKHFEL